MTSVLSSELKVLLDGTWESLRKRIHDPHSRLRIPVMATVDSRCNAHARTVIVEAIDSGAHKLYVNIDRRSPKVDEIRFRPEALFLCVLRR